MFRLFSGLALLVCYSFSSLLLSFFSSGFYVFVLSCLCFCYSYPSSFCCCCCCRSSSSPLFFLLLLLALALGLVLVLLLLVVVVVVVFLVTVAVAVAAAAAVVVVVVAVAVGAVVVVVVVVAAAVVVVVVVMVVVVVVVVAVAVVGLLLSLSLSPLSGLSGLSVVRGEGMTPTKGNCHFLNSMLVGNISIWIHLGRASINKLQKYGHPKKRMFNIVWLVVWNIFYFSISWEESSQLTFIFFRGLEITFPVWDLMGCLGDVMGFSGICMGFSTNIVQHCSTNILILGATCSPRNLTPPVEASDSCAWLRCCWEVAVLWPHSCQGSPDDKIFGIQREELKSATAWWFQTCFFLFSISYLGCHPYKIDELLIFFKMGAPATRQRMGFFKFISVMILGN